MAAVQIIAGLEPAARQCLDDSADTNSRIRQVATAATRQIPTAATRKVSTAAIRLVPTAAIRLVPTLCYRNMGMTHTQWENTYDIYITL